MSGVVIHGEGLGKNKLSGATPQGDVSRRIPELDGLRGFAILIVVLLHYFYKPGAGAPPAYEHFQFLFSLGWVGVDLFFVLSGFLIGGILLDARTSPSYFKTFYVRRFFRIIPIYFLWIILYIVVVGLWGNTLRAHMHSGLLPPLGFSVYEHFLFLQNIWGPNYVTFFAWWFGVTWSLAVEEQFYLVAPFLIRIFSGAKLRGLLVLILLGAPLLRTCFYLYHNPGYAYVAMPCRADTLAFGMLSALLWREEWFRIWLKERLSALYVIFAVLLAGMLVLWYWFSNPFHPLTLTAGYSWVALFFTVVLLLALVSPEGPVARCARMNWLRELGRVSYCVYLTHLAVAYVLFGLTMRAIPHISDLKSVGFTLVCAAVTYLAARLSWTYFEGPLVQIGHRMRYKIARPEEAGTQQTGPQLVRPDPGVVP